MLRHPAAVIINIIGLICGGGALGVQLSLTIPSSIAAGRTLLMSVVFYFSFFTILSNIAAVLVHTAALTHWRALSFFNERRVAGGVVAAMLVVITVYYFLLSHTWSPEGWFLICDRLLHYVTPVLIVVWWALSAEGRTRFAYIPSWLIYPFVYLAYVFARFAAVNEVPYPFLDPDAHSLTRIVTVCVAIFGLFVAASGVVVMIDRFLKPAAA